MDFGSIDQLKAVLDEMQSRGIIGPYAIGGAFAATLLNEPIATVDVDIFFVFLERPTGLVLDLSSIYDFAKEKGFTFDHEYIEIHGWLVQFVESSNSKLWTDAINSAATVNFIGVAPSYSA